LANFPPAGAALGGISNDGHADRQSSSVLRESVNTRRAFDGANPMIGAAYWTRLAERFLGRNDSLPPR
jgi:hypothetical protein